MKTAAARKTAHDARHALFLKIINLLWMYDDQGLRNIASEAGCHWVTLYNWKSARTTAPRLDKIAAVAAVLGYDLELVRRKRAALRRVK